MERTKTPKLGNRNFYWLWFAAVIAAMLLGTLWLGAWGLLAPVIGVGGALAALLFAKPLAVKAHGVRIINPANPRSEADHHLQSTVAALAKQAGLKHLPAVGVYDSPELNSFATGANEKGALIAFTRRLVDELDPAEIRAVAAHEVAHIANRDMFAMVLLQGAITSVVLFFLLPLVAIQVVLKLFGNGETWFFEGMVWALKIATTVAITAVGFLVVRMYSRRRELRADTSAARYCGRDALISALKALDRDDAVAPKSQLSYATFKIVGRPSSWEFLSTHPSYARRVANLENADASSEPMTTGDAGLAS